MSRTVEFEDCEATAETAAALLVVIPDFEDAIWIPKSQIDESSEVYREGSRGNMTVPVLERLTKERSG
jgi:hypothetical protein